MIVFVVFVSFPTMKSLLIFHIQEQAPHGVQRKSVLQLAIWASCSLHD